MAFTKHGHHLLDCHRASKHKASAGRRVCVNVAMTLAPLFAVDTSTIYAVPIFDQLQQSSCTANAYCGVVNYIHAKLGLPPIVPSRDFVYWNAGTIEGNEADDGRTITDTFAAGRLRGVCQESFYPYTAADLIAAPSLAAFSDGMDCLDLADAALSQDLATMFSALAAFYQFNIGVDCYDSFDTAATAATGIIPMPNVATESLEGGHALRIVGMVQKNIAGEPLDSVGGWYWKFANSWSDQWGDHGYGYLPLAFLLDTTLAFEPQVLKEIGPEPITPPKLMRAVAPNGKTVMLVGGFLDSVGDTSSIWQVGDALDALGYTVVRRAWDQVKAADFSGVQLVIDFSWGKAGVTHTRPAGQNFAEITICGVPCVIFGQWDIWGNTYWQQPTGPCINFTLAGAQNFPMDLPYQNWTEEADISGLGAVLPLAANTIVNVNIDSTGAFHTTAPTVILSQIVAAAQSLLPALAAPGVTP